MLIHLITIFPEFFDSALNVSIPKRAQDKQLVEICIHNLRDYTRDKHRTTDDSPFGGGAGMVMKPEPWFEAIPRIAPPDSPVIFLTPQGVPLSQPMVERLSREPAITLLCGRYKGLDERVRERFVTEEISIGDYVLSGGEPAALVLVDSIVRLIPGVLGDFESAEKDSFSGKLLDYPHYTRPQEIEGMVVPEILLSGHHKNIERWRWEQSLKRTKKRRPELLNSIELNRSDRSYLNRIEDELSKT
ncbi:MAG: tRNA (guanosine(37)-N1)-methyltransferase TrmD [Candidatus Cloacimonetes bacterium 4572_55]|nr:MAG: tRNA (guanosine(37)-N1)-methyltransferase TrmD [Candidatus Cloacimonetes bacterium 4572_55]